MTQRDLATYCCIDMMAVTSQASVVGMMGSASRSRRESLSYGTLGAWLRIRPDETFAGCGYGETVLGAPGVVCSGVGRAARRARSSACRADGAQLGRACSRDAPRAPHGVGPRGIARTLVRSALCWVPAAARWRGLARLSAIALSLGR